jgi:lysophospholipase L1-like esterase
MHPLRWLFSLLLSATLAVAASADSLANQKIVVLGDSITQAGGYVSFMDYYLQKLRPQARFEIYPLGLSSETVSGLSEPGHAGGKFARPCLSERLPRVLEKMHPDVVFACYGMNDGIYLPLEDKRFQAFKDGINHLLDSCQKAGVKRLILVTPPIYDATTKAGEFNYDAVLTAYAAWEKTLQRPGLEVVDLHAAMRAARDKRTEIFSKDRVHPGDEGHLLMARTILAGVGLDTPAEPLAKIKADPLFTQVDLLRRHRAGHWMNFVGYTREKVVAPTPLGDAEAQAAKIQAKIDELRKQ